MCSIGHVCKETHGTCKTVAGTIQGSDSGNGHLHSFYHGNMNQTSLALQLIRLFAHLNWPVSQAPPTVVSPCCTGRRG
jgi:hypothetical protein